MASGQVLVRTMPESSAYMSDHQDTISSAGVDPPNGAPRDSSPSIVTPDTPAIDPIKFPSPPHPQARDLSRDDALDMETSLSEVDEDAEGEEDADFDPSTTMPDPHNLRRSSNDSLSTTRAPKRKSDADEDDYMLQNPELYGLRRSGRAQPRRVIQSTSEDDDDDDDSDPPTNRARKRLKTAGNLSAASSRPYPNGLSRDFSSEADSDNAAYGASASARGPSKHRRRRLQSQSTNDVPSHAEVRFSTRQSARVSNYNEDEDDAMFDEDDPDDMTPSYWVTATEDTGPAVDVILNHRLLESSDKDPKVDLMDKHDYEFFIKWQGMAHRHATWDTWANLSKLRGFRRLENYYRKVVKEEQALAADPDIPLEEREKWILDRETYLEALEEYMKVERVIGSREGADDELEYFIKWRGLTYDFCTWESASLISSIAQSEIDRYLDRTSKLPVSDKKQANIATRSTYKPFRMQPDYIKHGQLREFQITGLNFLAHKWCSDDNVVLADEMGLGKTVQTVSFMNWLRHDRGQHGPFLVIVPLSTMPAWADTLNNWTPDINYVVYSGNEAARRNIQDYELLVDGNPRKVKFHVLLTTYEYILLDAGFLSQLKWQFMAVDEAHRLKNRESQLYIKLMDFGVPSRLLITGTPLQNNLAELSALMSFLMPGKFTMDEDIDLNSENAKQKLDQLNNDIQPYMIRRTKQKVESDLPPKSEKIIRVELSDVQLEYYKNILTRNYAALNAGAKGQKQSLLNVMMELKKASNHPFMFPNAEDRILAGSEKRDDQLKALITSSGKMMLLDQLLTKLKKDNHRVLIFSQMVKLLDILGDYLHLRGHQFQRLDGTIPSATRRHAIDHFNAPDSKDFCFILSTRAGGLGINLMTADTVILFDSDWNPQADLQAMARAHRIGQKKPVTIYRLVSKDTVEEEVLERARNKLMLEYITIHRAITDKDAQQINASLARAGVNVAEPTSSDDISRILKRRGQKMFEQSGNQRKLEELDIDAVLANAEDHSTEQDQGITADGGEDFLKSFEYTDVKVDLEWDEIIPKEQLEAIKIEEKRKEEERYLESVIEANQPRKRKAPADDARAQRAAKKRAMDLAAEAAADAESDDDSGADKDPKRPLKEKEIRNLVRAFERYGSLDDRQEELVKDARLVGRDINVLKATLAEILETSYRVTREEEERLRKIEKETGKPIAKKDRKAVLFDFRGVKRLNAETLIERPIEMRVLRDLLANTSDWRNFRVPDASKPANYTAPWGAKEDGMLCVGINKHGYGSWALMRDDPELGLTDKLFLEEHRIEAKEERAQADAKSIKSPGAVHLVRRTNYIMSVLKDKISHGTNIAAKRALENHHRNNRKGQTSLHRKPERTVSMSGSPAPDALRKLQRDDPQRHRNGSHLEPKQQHNSRKSNGEHDDRGLKHRKSEEQHRSPIRPLNGESRPEDTMKRLFSPILECLQRVSQAHKHSMPDETKRLKVIKVALLSTGNHVKQLIRKGSKVSEERLWDWVAQKYWPQAKKAEKYVNGAKIRDLYVKMSAKEAAATKAEARDVKSDGRSDSKPDVEAVVEPSATADVKPVVEPSTTADVKADVETNVKPDAKPEADTKPNPT